MRIVAIIQARMNSTRLPGKVLLDLNGETMLSRVVRRVKRTSMLNEIVVATSDNAADDVIENECEKLNVPVFRGNESDVLDRYYQASLFHKAEVVVRITSDCPLIEPTIIDKVIAAFLNSSNVDYASNTLVRTYPRGLDTEVFTASALASASREAIKPYHRAHVTPYIYENPNFFKLLSVTSSSDYSCYRWTVDTAEDFQFIQRVYEILSYKETFDWCDVLKLCERDPSLIELNRSIKQKPLEQS